MDQETKGLPGAETMCRMEAHPFPPPGKGMVSDGSQVQPHLWAVAVPRPPTQSWTLPDWQFVELWHPAANRSQSQGDQTGYWDKEPWGLRIAGWVGVPSHLARV